MRASRCMIGLPIIPLAAVWCGLRGSLIGRIIQNQFVYFSKFSLFLLSSVAYAIDEFETYNLIVPGFELKEFERSQTSRILE